MARRLDERVEEIRVAVANPNDAASLTTLKRAFTSTHGYLISIAARALGAAPTLVPSAVAAFNRLCVQPIKRDPQCHGKVAIVRALYELEHPEPEPFETGVDHVQLEPVFGGRQDTAAELRGLSVMALINQGHPRAWVHAAARLADPERTTRLAALRSIEAGGRPDLAEPLLRLSIEHERDPEVLLDAFAALLRLDGSAHLPLVEQRMVGADPTVADAAALAIGSARPPGGLDVLAPAFENLIDKRRVVATAIAMLRTDAAWQHLVETVLEGDEPLARASIDALASFRDHPGLAERVRDAVEDRGLSSLRTAFDEGFQSRS